MTTTLGLRLSSRNEVSRQAACGCPQARLRPASRGEPQLASPGSAAGQLRRGAARADLGLQRGELVVHVRGRPGLVELLLDVVGVAADILQYPGLQQLVQRAG